MPNTQNATGLYNPDGSVTFYGNTGGGGSGGETDVSDYAKQEELSNLVLTGTTNTSGATIAAGTCFVLNGDFVTAKADIASGATFTLNTNYEKKSVGSILTELNSKIIAQVTADGVKTYNDILYDLSSSVMALSSSDRARTFLLTDFGAQQPGQINNTYLISYDHTSMDSNNDVIMRFYVIDTRKANCKYKIKTISGTTISFTDMTDTVPSNGTVFTVHYR